MEQIADRFAERFAHWNITLPPGNVRRRQRGKIVQGGWTIWYLFGQDAQGEYLDYYACHRMTDDSHVRLYADGTQKDLEIVIPVCMCSDDPVEDARLHAEYAAKNQQILRNLQAKGFVLEGDEPGHVGINWYLQASGEIKQTKRTNRKSTGANRQKTEATAITSA